MNRNILILGCSQALGMAGAPMVVLLGGIIGADLAPDPSWTTMPMALMVVGGALCSIPAALLMRKIGRRAGFMIASLVAAAAATLGALAIADDNFFLFCLATIGLGANMAFVQQYRFAAAESVEQSQVGRAVSFDHHFVHYWTGLILLGVGWNFLFIGGTALLTRSYRASERFRAQAINDFVIFGFQALASLSAGAVIFRTSWQTVNIISLPLLTGMLVLLVVRQRLATSS